MQEGKVNKQIFYILEEKQHQLEFVRCHPNFGFYFCNIILFLSNYCPHNIHKCNFDESEYYYGNEA